MTDTERLLLDHIRDLYRLLATYGMGEAHCKQQQRKVEAVLGADLKEA